MATEQMERRSTAAEHLRQYRSDLNAERTVASLCDGIDLVADLLLTRIDRDVEQNFSLDSMLMPPSTKGEVQASVRVRKQIDIYSAAVAAEEAARQCRVDVQDTRFTKWFFSLGLDEPEDLAVARRLKEYRALSPDEQRRHFASAIERRMPHATNAPLVIYRLYPLGVQLVVAVAFGDHLRAGELRNQQMLLLPVISDCHDCHGQPLDNGEVCHPCGNPLWKYDWLCVAD